MGILLKIIFIGIAIYYVLKFLFRFFLGAFIVKVNREFANKSTYQNTNQRSSKPNDGVEVKYVPNNEEKHIKGGDYVDFEEVNETK